MPVADDEQSVSMSIMNPIVRSKALMQESWTDASKWTSNMAAAEVLLREALKASPDDKAVLTCLGAVLCDGGQHKKAVGVLKRAVKLGSQDRNTHHNLGVALLGSAAHEEAMAVFSLIRIFDPSPDTWEAYFDPQAY